ncbi:hypothetical protein C0992_001433 [Termitomyces sp. T32_za158]|nr:hypothetical protein C0992_001433 [Termitomyces sp. T32_za158]
MSNSNGLPLDSDMDDEVDQLISDSESPETDPDPLNAAAAAHRIPGHSLLPAVRLENIVSADGVTGNLSLSKEGLFILSVAAEEFIKKMAQAGHLRATNERRAAVDYSDMCAATQQYQEFMFLKETIPVPIPLSEAITLRAQREKEAQESDPTAPSSSSSSTRPALSHPHSAPKKPKPRPNGSTPKHDKRPPKDPADTAAYTEWTDTRPARPGPGGRPAISAYNGRISLTVPRPSPLANGHTAVSASVSVSAAPSPSRAGTLTPAHHDPASDAASASVSAVATATATQEEREAWSAQQPPYATGPASGFLQGPGAPFGRALQNPGRTIYSQEYRPE